MATDTEPPPASGRPPRIPKSAPRPSDADLPPIPRARSAPPDDDRGSMAAVAIAGCTILGFVLGSLTALAWVPRLFCH